MRFKTLLRRTALVFSIPYAAVCVLLYAKQDTLVYLARTAPEASQLAEAPRRGVEPWRSAEGALLGWRRSNPGAGQRILAFHGNAGQAQDRAHFIDALQHLDGGRMWEVYLFEYPGFGARPGPLGEAEIAAAARAAADELLAADPRPLFLMGESLGSGPACTLAGALGSRIPGVLLVVPYASLLDAAQHLYPWAPVSWLLRDRFDNEAALRRYTGRVGFVVAGEDEVVTTAGGERLHAGYAGLKRLRVFSGAGHNDIDYSQGADWWREMSEFLLSR